VCITDKTVAVVVEAGEAVLLVESRSGTAQVRTAAAAAWLTALYWMEELSQTTALFTAATFNTFFVAHRLCV
jgi:hypothetical protein